jgi:hypothetical protein
VIARLYSLALLAFPKPHRSTYAAEMRIAFTRELIARRRSGRWAAFHFTTAALSNALAAGLGARWHYYRANPATTPTISPLDVVLAWRMLLRYPGLSIVSIFGITIGIAIAATAFTVMSALMNAELPLPAGDRIVSLLNHDVSTSNRESRLLYDFASWRTLDSVEDMSITRAQHSTDRSAPRGIVFATMPAAPRRRGHGQDRDTT